jgi:hypothetical protein
MENSKSSKLQVVLVLSAFAVGLAFRLIRLGVFTLNNMEADFALQALAVARGTEVLFNGQSAYVGLTGLLFYGFTPVNFLARFWPAFLGGLVVFIPFTFRKVIGLWPASIASFVLAISPEMVSLSRMVGSPMLALVFLMLAIGFWIMRKPILMGVSLGMALMSGPGFWVGLVILAVSLALSDLLFGIQDVFNFEPQIGVKTFWVHFGAAMLMTLLVVGTNFFLAPAGLSGIFSGLYAFVLGFGHPFTVQFSLILFALFTYGMGAIGLGLWGAITGILVKRKLDMFLITWALVGLIFVILYPSGKPADLIWVTLPLWILGARVTSSAWWKPEDSQLVVAITTTAVVVIGAFMMLALRSLVYPALTQSQQVNYLIALLGGVVLVVAVVILVSYGWSEDVARSGLLLGIALILTAGMIAVSVNASGIGDEAPYTLWYPDEPVLIPEWMQVTIDRTLVWNARRFTPVDIIVAGIDTPGLRWALRQFEPLVFDTFVPPQLQPGMIITPVDVIPAIANAYQGQSLVWQRFVPWHEMTSRQYLIWLIAGEVPTISQEVILWVRADLMPGGRVTE